MSFHFYLYRADDGLPPVNKWEQMHAESLGDSEQLKKKLNSIFRDLRWIRTNNSWNGMGPNPINNYLDIWLMPEADGQVHFIIMNKAPPSAMRIVLEAFNLNYVAAPEAGDLVDVYAYDDNDLYYAKKNCVE